MCVHKFLPNNYKGCVGIIRVNGATFSLYSEMAIETDVHEGMHV